MIRVGTDCSGIEAPIQALQQLGIPFRHVFSCDIDKYVVESIKANYKPEIIFGDMKKRKLSQVPDIDLYVCGFPCQPFSIAGSREGTDDPRGTIFWQCLKVIKKKLPKVFILENVKGILSINDGETFEEIIKSLKKIKKYNIYWNVLNTRDYGIPQNRERVFIVGIREDQDINFLWPNKKPMDDIKNYVDWNDTEKDKPTVRIKTLLKNIPKDSVFIDTSFAKAKFPNSNNYCPCLNTKNDFWCVPLKRYINTKELLSLQGFPKNFNQVVSKTQMKKQIGNSMSVNFLKELFKKIYN
jgi:DNA (cytosine-5)-methyltransferase 1